MKIYPSENGAMMNVYSVYVDFTVLEKYYYDTRAILKTAPAESEVKDGLFRKSLMTKSWIETI